MGFVLCTLWYFLDNRFLLWWLAVVLYLIVVADIFCK